MDRKKIVVIGSSNTDMVVKSDRLPAPGETVLGGRFIMNPGGKGANQAVAAARLNGDVTFIAKVGNDVFGQEAISGFKSHGIQTDFVISDPDNPSGVALIMVDSNGENCISVALGANAALQKSDIDAAKKAIVQADLVLIQLEIPMPVVEYAVQLAVNAGAEVVLNPAPAQPLTDQLLANLSIISPNETEAELLTGIQVEDLASIKKAAKALRDKGVETVIITLGSKGAYIQSKDLDELVPSPKVQAVDTTAAGDTFNGALVVGLSEGMSLLDAVAFANQAAAFSVTKLGAQASVPTRSEL
ncbi:MAG: ribokinase [Bacteroidota bacterium]